jgi:hypothetical protein
MPLVNEVVIGWTAKDKFNASRPRNDSTFADYVTNPVLLAVLRSQFPLQLRRPTFRAPT